MVDELDMTLEAIEEEGSLIMNDQFIMVIFQEIMDELTTFEKYWTHMFQNKSMPIVGDCHSNVFPFSRLLNDLLSPEDNKNNKIYSMIREIAVTSSKALVAEIGDGNKSTVEHLSSNGGGLCWDNTSNADHAASLFKMAVNDPSERYFDAMIGQLQYYGKIILTNSGGVSQVRVNGDLSRVFDTGCNYINC